ncbi:hypothetical protein [Salinarchaeum chitinilyticum]
MGLSESEALARYGRSLIFRHIERGRAFTALRAVSSGELRSPGGRLSPGDGEPSNVLLSEAKQDSRDERRESLGARRTPKDE